MEIAVDRRFKVNIGKIEVKFMEIISIGASSISKVDLHSICGTRWHIGCVKKMSVSGYRNRHCFS